LGSWDQEFYYTSSKDTTLNQSVINWDVKSNQLIETIQRAKSSGSKPFVGSLSLGVGFVYYHEIVEIDDERLVLQLIKIGNDTNIDHTVQTFTRDKDR
jgi:hypothetical protein